VDSPPVLCFTGARTGLTPAQLAALRVVLAGYPGATLHNGCAEGADEAALDIAYDLGLRLECWPCNYDQRERAWNYVYENPLATLHPTAPPLERNRRMVAAASVVVACPDSPERLRSGTWSTVREARRRGREVVIVWPDGSVTREDPRP
jgi:cytosine/adenosine deaminase-related metal-dependent hydrolase